MRHAFADTLPIDAVLQELAAALAGAGQAVLVAPPGAGKTTRVPLALLDAPWRGDGRIIMMEPRRLAARAAATRMAGTLGQAVGETVGYRVRLEAKVSARTRIEVVTEGVFTRMILADPELAGVAAVIFDEFHERSLDADLGLALARDARELRPDLRLVVMSATLDGARVSALLADAPVIVSEGRAFPVETRHLPRDPDQRIEDAVAGAVRLALGAGPGNCLAFLPGEAEIRRTAERLTGRLPAGVELLPLYGQLPPAEQDRALRPPPDGMRRVVLATAIAETSLTLPDIRIVVDGGLRRAPAYEPATGMSRLVTRPVSRAAADQRRGRAGRTAPGLCFRLWHQGQEAALDAYDRPEMLEADLSGLVLDLALWGVTDPGQLGFLDPPPAPAWAEAVDLLQRLDALDAKGRITPAGRDLQKLPLHPRLAHMVMASGPEGSTDAAAQLAVLLGERGLGGDGVDLAHRLDRMRGERGQRADAARGMAARWARLAGTAKESGSALAGRLLARAYPDRVAQNVDGRGRFRLANGRQASLDPAEALARAPFLVVADLSGAAGDARIRSAAALSREDLDALFGHRIVGETVLSFDAGAASVRARRQVRLDALKLADQPVAVEDIAGAATLLAEGIARLGISKLPWTREQKALRARIGFLRATLGEDWPDLSDDSLANSAAEWLAPFIAGRLSLGEITAADLGNALDGLVSYGMRQEMEGLLPSHYDAPSGSRLPIEYGGENGPTLSIRVQELFGLDRHPAIARGKVKLLLVLLSPAQRPIQTTRDLPGFWRGSWRDVVKDLKGRYPRHPWPDDPLVASPTARAKPRGT